MTQLALAVNATDELWTLDNLPTPEAPYVEVGDELIEVRSRFPASYYTLTGETLPPRIRVRRGIAGTTKASHVLGSTLTPNYGLGSSGEGGAGGVTVDNQSDPPAEVTTLIAPGADLSTPGEAGFVGGSVVEPGSVQLGFAVNGSVAAPFFRIHAQNEVIEVFNDLGEPVVSIQGSQVHMGATSEMPSSLDLRTNRVGFAIGTGAPFRLIDANSADVLVQVDVNGAVLLPELPTADPVVAGQLWNDAGTLKVSAG